MDNKSLITEELLKPRYKVVSDWPGRKDFTVGQIITLDKDFSPEYKMWTIEDCQGERQYITKFFEMFPLQFKRLDWQEERSVSGLPKYIKGHDGKIFEVFKYRIEKKVVARITDTFWNTQVWQELGEPWWMPATKEEYESFINKK